MLFRSAEALVCDFRGENEKEIEADVFIWSGGIRAPSVLQKSGLLLDAKGRVDVHDTLLAKGNDNVFALGDCAALLDPKTNRAVPGLGQVAVLEAPLVAENIRRALKGESLKKYYPKKPASIIPVGPGWAAASVGPFIFYGIFSWILRRAADFRYFVSVIGWRKTLKVFFAKRDLCDACGICEPR